MWWQGAYPKGSVCYNISSDFWRRRLKKKDGERVLESIRGKINPLEQYTAIGYSPSVTAGVEGIKSFSEPGVSRSMVTLVETVFGLVSTTQDLLSNYLFAKIIFTLTMYILP